MRKPGNSDKSESVKTAISDCASATHLTCELTTVGCPVALLQSTLEAATTLLKEYDRLVGLIAQQQKVLQSLANLTPRQHEIMDMVLAGHPSKNIAADLGISQRTVENHRATIMKKTGAKSLPELARLAVAAEPRS